MFGKKVDLILLFVFLICFRIGNCRKSCPASEGNKEPIVKAVTDPVEHGEEPHWDAVQKALYFVDITSQNVLRYNPADGSVNSLHFDNCNAVTPVIPVRNNPNLLVVGVDRTLTLVKWSGTSNCTYSKDGVQHLDEVDDAHPGNRFNDGKADKDGRLWIGTIGHEDSNGVVPNEAALYRITGNSLSEVEVAIPNVTNSNGLCWNKANDKFYYIDTQTRTIAKYKYDAKNGQISDKKIAFDLSEHKILDGALPDGMTIDRDDNLWIALYNGHSVIKVNPRNGKLLERILVPGKDITSVMFGGKHLDVLYVTTSRRDLTPAQRKETPTAGSVFAITNLGVCGHDPAYTVAFGTE